MVFWISSQMNSSVQVMPNTLFCWNLQEGFKVLSTIFTKNKTKQKYY